MSHRTRCNINKNVEVRSKNMHDVNVGGESSTRNMHDVNVVGEIDEYNLEKKENK
ncbi:hypothetical protein C5167_030319 [Papaver somniferum]|nr:hypothetical protein C5167_030319 [Papaver somniferum]